MTNPCGECIVNAMCLKSCNQFETYLESSIPTLAYYRLKYRNMCIILWFMRVSALSDKVIEVKVLFDYSPKSHEHSKYVLVRVKKGDIISVDDDYKYDEDAPSEQPMRDTSTRIEIYTYKDHGMRLEFIYKGSWWDILPRGMLGPYG